MFLFTYEPKPAAHSNKERYAKNDMLGDTKAIKAKVGGIYESFLGGVTQQNTVLFLVLLPAKYAVDESGNDEIGNDEASINT